MNSQEKNKEDILRHYINPEMTEQAPEGFTSRVMNRIGAEALPLKTARRSWIKNPVPVISAVVTVLLIAAAFLIPGSESDSLTLPVLKFLGTIKLSMPEIDLSSILRFSMPSVMIYVFIGILVLTLFDRVLYSIFHRERNT